MQKDHQRCAISRALVFCSTIVFATSLAVALLEGNEESLDKYALTKEVLTRGTAMVKEILRDPASLRRFDSTFVVPPAYLHPRFGLSADYALWLKYRVAYEDILEQIYAYKRLKLRKACAEDPISAPIVLERLAVQLETAKSVITLISQALEAVDIAPPGDVSVRSAKGNAVDILDAACQNAHTAIDREALRSLSPKERRLLPFLVRWLCATGGKYQARSVDAPAYKLGFWLDPPESFEPDSKTTKLGMTIPEEFPSMTSIFNFFRSLAGEELTNNGLNLSKNERSWSGRHRTFKGLRIDMEAMGRAFAIISPLLEKDFRRELEHACLRLPNRREKIVVPGVEGEVLLFRKTPYGDLLIGGPGSNTYNSGCQASVIIDIGGDDTYRAEYDLARLGRYPLRFIMDLHGNDVYAHSNVIGPGAGVFGLGIVLDQEGNDVYCQGVDPLRARNREQLLVADTPSGIRRVDPGRAYGGGQPASLDGGFSYGAAMFGIGLNIDLDGEDTYLTDKLSLGAAFGLGVGILLDEGGNDWYIAATMSIGMALNKGIGILRDSGPGADRYQCWGVYQSSYTTEVDQGFQGLGIGSGSSWTGQIPSKARSKILGGLNKDSIAVTNPISGEGIGVVIDGGGNDTYVGGDFSMGEGMYGIGALLESGGDDIYLAMKGENGVQNGVAGIHCMGEAAHRGIGMLLDRAGNDLYSGSYQSGGNGWDMGAGYLIDIAGDDTYTDLMKKGFQVAQAGAQSIAVLLDGDGADTLGTWCSGLGSVTDNTTRSLTPGGNFCFAILLGSQIDRLPEELSDVLRGPITLRPIPSSMEDDGKEYPKGVGLVIIEAPPLNHK